jgi:hypothetical protein
MVHFFAAWRKAKNRNFSAASSCGPNLGMRFIFFYNPLLTAIKPSSVQVCSGSSTQFSPVFKGNVDPQLRINWSIYGRTCVESACGTISEDGLYTAPLVVPDNPIKVEATAVADLGASAHNLLQKRRPFIMRSRKLTASFALPVYLLVVPISQQVADFAFCAACLVLYNASHVGAGEAKTRYVRNLRARDVRGKEGSNDRNEPNRPSYAAPFSSAPIPRFQKRNFLLC